MKGVIGLGDLAKELGSSKQKIGQLVKKFKIKKIVLNINGLVTQCITEKDVEIIKDNIDDFHIGFSKRSSKVKKEPKVKEPKVKEPKVKESKVRKAKKKKPQSSNEDRFFVNPIMSVDIRSGLVSGPGIWKWWEMQKCATKNNKGRGEIDYDGN